MDYTYKQPINSVGNAHTHDQEKMWGTLTNTKVREGGMHTNGQLTVYVMHS